MELRQLRYFLAVARTLNFTRAAEDVHIAQPPFSRQIANLEDELGVKLLERGPRAMSLTPAGEHFAEHATDILRRIQRLKTETAEKGESGQKVLRIGLEMSLLYGNVPNVIRHLRKLHPGIRFELQVLSGERLLPSLRDGETDILVGRECSSDPELEQITLRMEPLVLALPAGHAMASHADTGIYLRDAKGESFIMHLTTGSGLTDVAWRLCDKSGIDSQDRIVLHDISAVLGLVAAGAGVAVVPAIANALRRDDIVYVPLLDEGALSPVVIGVKRGKNEEIFREIHAESLRLVGATRDGGRI